MITLRNSSCVVRNINLHFSFTDIGTSSLHTSSVLNRRSGKRVRNVPEYVKEKYSNGPWWMKPRIVMKSPLATTYHPVNQFQNSEENFLQEVNSKSCQDLPIDIDDPYSKEPKMCILCPRQCVENITPNYKNVKLLSQFVSPHTGKVYQCHITGLCNYMQALVEREVKRSRAAGLMSTRVIDPIYLQDPPLINPNKPIKKNPY